MENNSTLNTYKIGKNDKESENALLTEKKISSTGEQLSFGSAIRREYEINLVVMKKKSVVPALSL